MKRRISLFLALLLLLQMTAQWSVGQVVATKEPQLSERAKPLTNQDIVLLSKAGLDSEIIVAKVKNSPCAFDIVPARLEELKTNGVPASVITEMIQATRHADEQSSGTSPPQPTQPLQIPDGTRIEIEAPYQINSHEFRPNDEISFRVLNPIKINGFTVIDQGATATGRIVKSKRGGHFGKAGLLVWTMQSVTAVDGSQIPLRTVLERLRGDSKTAKVATQMIVTGALLPFIAPVALLHGFKRGKDAFIPAGKRYEVFVTGPAGVKVSQVRN